ncbi:MAG: hypothetical protein QOI81_1242 [Actinomycetota bacterium]|nr:hypothetical protein [Actinomycetota bacterium]
MRITLHAEGLGAADRPLIETGEGVGLHKSKELSSFIHHPEDASGESFASPELELPATQLRSAAFRVSRCRSSRPSAPEVETYFQRFERCPDQSACRESQSFDGASREFGNEWW